jgi:hypothetical protein
LETIVLEQTELADPHRCLALREHQGAHQVVVTVTPVPVPYLFEFSAEGGQPRLAGVVSGTGQQIPDDTRQESGRLDILGQEFEERSRRIHERGDASSLNGPGSSTND